MRVLAALLASSIVIGTAAIAGGPPAAKPPTAAKLLKVAPLSPAFFVERVTSDAKGPFEHVSSVMRGDRYRIRLAIQNSAHETVTRRVPLVPQVPVHQ